jgi:1-aminocyclopropane-1-carboxylate deaminase/D-cysteine desulfhydrase-like pyridoxal-dependent ACC family enzyme
MDTQHSMAGWGAAYVCRELKLSCVNFFPVLKADKGLRYNQIKAKELGADLYPMKAGMSAILFNQAKKILKEQCKQPSIMLPNGLKLTETVQATALEVIEHTPTYLQGGTWVVSISSATIASGVIKGINELGFKATVMMHMGYSRSADQVHRYVNTMAGDHPYVAVQIVDEDYEYKDKVDNAWIPFPCNEFYDAKAFTWLAKSITSYIDNQPIIFWNCGA